MRTSDSEGAKRGGRKGGEDVRGNAVLTLEVMFAMLAAVITRNV